MWQTISDRLFRRTKTLEGFSDAEAIPLDIVRDAAFATMNAANGKLMPVVIVDVTRRPEIKRLIDTHEHVDFGEVKTSWGWLVGQKHDVCLFLEFEHPIQVKAILAFDIEKHSSLIDLIVKMDALYLQYRHLAVNFSQRADPNDPTMTIEVGAFGFEEIWESKYRKYLLKKYRSKGMTRQNARQAVELHISKQRELGGFRIRK